MRSSPRLLRALGTGAALLLATASAEAAGRGGGGIAVGGGGAGRPGFAQHAPGGHRGGAFAGSRFDQSGYGRGYGTDGLGRRGRYRTGFGDLGFGFGGYGYGGFATEDGAAGRGGRTGCCEPHYPVALGIRPAPTLPPTLYVIDGRGRRGAMRRSAIGPVFADSRGPQAGLRVIRVP